LENVDIFYGYLEYFTDIWYLFPVLVSCAKKNLATLVLYLSRESRNDLNRRKENFLCGRHSNKTELEIYAPHSSNCDTGFYFLAFHYIHKALRKRPQFFA
jgi:hypothetical protein